MDQKQEPQPDVQPPDAEIEAMKNDPAFGAVLANPDQDNPEHQKLLERWDELHQQASEAEAANEEARAAADVDPDVRGIAREGLAVFLRDCPVDPEKIGSSELYRAHQETMQDPIFQETTQYALEAGLSTSDIAHRFAHVVRAAVKGPPADPQAWRATLQDEWGAEFDERYDAAAAEWEKLPMSFRDFLTRTQAVRDPEILRWLSQLGMRRQRERS